MGLLCKLNARPAQFLGPVINGPASPDFAVSLCSLTVALNLSLHIEKYMYLVSAIHPIPILLAFSGIDLLLYSFSSVGFVILHAAAFLLMTIMSCEAHHLYAQPPLQPFLWHSDAK